MGHVIGESRRCEERGTQVHTWRWEKTPPPLEWEAQGFTVGIAESNSEWK